MRSFGETIPWGEDTWDLRTYVTPKEVYVWRAFFQNTEFEDPAHIVPLVRAIGSQIADFDVRGVTIDNSKVDVVMTVRDYLPFPVLKWPPGWDTASDLEGFVLSDSEFRSIFPFSSIKKSNLLQLTGPPQAMDFWLAHEILWDNNIGPKDGLARLRGIYRGNADDGNNLIAWTKGEPSLISNGKSQSDVLSASSSAVFWTIAAVGVAWLGLRLYDSDSTGRDDSTQMRI